MTFGRRKVAPRVCVADAKRHIRTFLGDALEEIGFITSECASPADMPAALDALPDLVVLGFSAGGGSVADMLRILAAHRYGGKVILIGGQGVSANKAAQELGAELGLEMLPGLGAPYRAEDLYKYVSPLLPNDPPPRPPVDVEEALDQDWLELWYQPKIDVRTLTLFGAEALVRMRHPTWGIVPPAYFVPGPDDPHFRALSEFVIARAMEDWAYFVAEYSPVQLSINLPVAFLRDPTLVGRMQALLPRHPAFKGLLVEITGNEVLRNCAQAREIARELGLHDIGIAIDDLGADWGWLTTLDDIPFTEFKVERRFIHGCSDDPLKRVVCQTIVDLAQRFGVRTVAEGVETRADFVTVRDTGFDLVQGFLFAKPMERRKFARTMLARRMMPQG